MRAANEIIEDDTESEDDESFIAQIEFSTVHSARLKMFSDAVWAIIATISIAPLMHLKLIEELGKHNSGSEEDVTHLWDTLMQKIPTYFLTFLIVCNIWTCHVWTFQTMRQVTDLSIIVNLVIMLSASLLPYFYSVLTQYQETTSIIIYSCLQIFIAIIQGLLVYHAFEYPGLLTEKLEQKSTTDKAMFRRQILYRLTIGPVFCMIAIFLAFFSVTAALVSLLLILIYPWIKSLLKRIVGCFPKCYTKIHGKRFNSRDLLWYERIKMKRTEFGLINVVHDYSWNIEPGHDVSGSHGCYCFTDGVFAITATLVALDITEKQVPKPAVVDEMYNGVLAEALKAKWVIYVSYILLFFIIGLTWYTHLTLFKNMGKFSRIMSLTNNIALACVGFLPLGFTLILKYAIPGALIAGIRFSCVAIFIIGGCYVIMYFIALYMDYQNRPKNKIWLSIQAQPGGKEFNIIMYQLVGLPIACAIVYTVTFTGKAYVSAYLLMAVVLLYTILLVTMRTILHFWKKLFHRDRRLTTLAAQPHERTGLIAREE